MYKILMVALALAIMTACKKEDAKYNKTDIISFEMNDENNDLLKASVSGDTIYVYWPPLQDKPTTVTPTIAVHETSAILPASGTEVDLSKEVKYIVTAQNGQQKTYTVKLIQNQPYPYITLYSNLNSANGNRFWVNTATVTLQGDYLKVKGQETSVWLTPQSGEPFKATITSNTGARLAMTAPPKGIYNMTVQVGIRTLEAPFSFEVIDPFVTPRITTPTGATTVKKGETFTLTGVELNGITEATIDNYDAEHFLEVVSTTATSVTLRVPATVPAKTYSRMRYVYKSGQYYNGQSLYVYFTGVRVLTVTE